MPPAIRVTAVLALVAGAIGIVLVRHRAGLWVGPRAAPSSAAEVTDPHRLVKTVEVMSELAADKPLRLAVSGQFGEPSPGSTVKFLFASQPHYAGPLVTSAVETIVTHGRADVLEHRLGPAAHEALRATIGAFDETVRDVSLLIDEEEQRVKAELRKRPDRQIRIATRPREQDPAYFQLREAQAKLPAKDGAIWGEIEGDGERHLIVRWDEWTALREMHKDRFYMMSERARRVRKWITEQFHVRGMALFAGAAAEPESAEPSPAPGESK
jgi:hypothetical protein